MPPVDDSCGTVGVLDMSLTSLSALCRMVLRQLAAQQPCLLTHICLADGSLILFFLDARRRNGLTLQRQKTAIITTVVSTETIAGSVL